MLGGFFPTDINDWYFATETLFKGRIVGDVDLTGGGAELGEKRSDGGYGFFA